MFNYNNLSDIEFEELCKDIMEKKLSKKLRIYASGRDGGIDLSDYQATNETVIQIKHYMNSSFSSLKLSLKKEVEKVKKFNPKNYYICVSKNLSVKNVREIYDMFKMYMESTANVVDLSEIDCFLEREENSDIVRKHYKLWLHSTGVLSDIYNQNIFVDCEALLTNINTEKQYFIQTNIYNTCLKYLMKDRIILMTGAPGVGKTMTSKMILLEYASQGYKVRYTTNASLTDVKRSLSANKNVKEIILLDDCLGQHYFKMNENKENELLSLINYVQMNPNKSLIMNSRITIFNEAKGRSIDFKRFFNRTPIMNYVIDMNAISILDKSKIFYSHLYFNKIPVNHFKELKRKKRYKEIVTHKNYTPRIIEFTTDPSIFEEISEKDYFSYVINSLDTPNNLWQDEFDNRLNPIDRIFMLVLYSLTDTIAPIITVKECFEERLLLESNIDTTINNFDNVLSRLNDSMVSVFDLNGKQNIGVSNPSINDFLKPRFEDNLNELSKIKKSIIYLEQLKRSYGKDNYKKKLIDMVKDHSISTLKSEYQGLIQSYLVSIIVEENILDPFYIDGIHNYLLNSEYKQFSVTGTLDISIILNHFIDEKAFTMYEIKDVICNFDNFELMLENITDFEVLIDTINITNDIIDIYDLDIDESMFNEKIEYAIKELIIQLASAFDTTEYSSSTDDVLEKFMDAEENFVDSKIYSELSNLLEDEFTKSIYANLERLNNDIKYENVTQDMLNYLEVDIENIIQNYTINIYEPDYDFKDEISDEPEHLIDDVELIFERDMM